MMMMMKMMKMMKIKICRMIGTAGEVCREGGEERDGAVSALVAWK